MQKKAYCSNKNIQTETVSSDTVIWADVCVRYRVQLSPVSPSREAGVTMGEKNPLSAQWNRLTDSSSKAGKKTTQMETSIRPPTSCWSNLFSDDFG